VFLSEDEQAKARFEEVLEHTPTHVLACIELGKLLTRRGELERAKELLQQAVLHNNMRSTLPEMFADGQRGSGHAAALAWMNLGRLALVAGDDEELGAAAAAGHLLDDLDDEQRVLLLAKEARAAGKPVGAMVALEALLERQSDHEEAMEQWLEVALDELQLFDQLADLAKASVEEYPEYAARLTAEVLARQPEHAGAREIQARTK
jgi:lipopolysaccharide biosynthesis regulator YciM